MSTAPSPSSPPPRQPSLAGVAPEVWAPARRLALGVVRPLERFLHVQAASGLILLAAALIALAWANSSASASYEHLWHTPLGLRVGSFAYEQPLHFWINDGLMTVFFFVVGLEIRREMHGGELSDFRRALLPIGAAAGGMLVPALLYVATNAGRATSHGWGVPMATDIAFAVGVLALLGPRVPPALRVLLLALAIIDDIGAIVVIALFYSAGFQISGLAIAALGVVGLLAMQKMGVRRAWAYVPAGIVIWAGFLASGIHPTIGGVVVGLLTPATAWLGERGFVDATRAEVAAIEERLDQAHDPHEVLERLDAIAAARREATAPVVRIEAALHGYVAYGIMPLFALANAGVDVRGISLEGDALAASGGVLLGLVVGKPVGVVLVSLLLVKLGVASLPRGVTVRGLLVVGLVAGIGFTMAIFIAQLGFADPVHLSAAKLAVLLASGLSAGVALVYGRLVLAPPTTPEERGAATVDEAERSTEL